MPDILAGMGYHVMRQEIDAMVDRQQTGLIWNMPLPRTRWMIVGFVAGVFTWSFAGGGQQHRVDEKSKVADTEARRSGWCVRQHPPQTESRYPGYDGKRRDRITNVQNSAHNRSLSTRSRIGLAGEKSLDDDRIEVEIREAGTVVLSGQVPDATAKETAVDIARDTSGVLKVEDRLSVPPAPRVFAVKTDETAARNPDPGRA